MRMIQLLLVILCVVVSCLANPLQLLSFNTRLAPNELLVGNRFLKTLQTLRKTEGDVVCLQEVWNDEHMFSIFDGLQFKYPFSYSFLHEETGNLAERTEKITNKCDDDARKQIFQCLNDKCMTSSDSDDFLNCFISECNPIDLKLEEGCTECLSLQVEACTKETVKSYSYKKMKDCIKAINSIRGICASRTLSGRANHGLIMLSNMPLKNQERGVFTQNSLIGRGYLEAKNMFGETFVCTQMTPGRLPVYSEIKTPYNNWYDLKKNEVEQIIDRYSTKQQTYILGNLNVGPAVREKRIMAYYADLYQLMEEHGLENIFASEGRDCTLCSNNQLAKDEVSSSYLVDGCIPINVERPLINNKVIWKGDVLLDPRSRRNFPLSEHYCTLAVFKDIMEIFFTSQEDGSGSGRFLP